MLSENKTALQISRFSKYFIYAIVEIVLFVIGILIALSIYNWNENRKINESIKVLVQSLLIDLKQDSKQLTTEIRSIRKDLDDLNNFRIRLSKKDATIDTVKHIAKFEYLTFFDPTNELNKNTIISLLSTGNTDYFEKNFKLKILLHNSEQIKFLRAMDVNVFIFLNSQNPNTRSMQSEILFLQSAVVKGPLLEMYWDNKDDNQLLDVILFSLTSKNLM